MTIIMDVPTEMKTTTGSLHSKLKRKNDDNTVLQGVKIHSPNITRNIKKPPYKWRKSVVKCEENMGPCKAKRRFSIPKSETFDHDYLKKEPCNEIKVLNEDVIENLQRRYGLEIANDIIKTLGQSREEVKKEGEGILDASKEANEINSSKGSMEIESLKLLPKPNTIPKDTIPKEVFQSTIDPAMLSVEQIRQMYTCLLEILPQMSETFSKNVMSTPMNLSCNNVTQDDGMEHMDTTSAINAKSQFVMRSSFCNVESPAFSTINSVNLIPNDSLQSTKSETTVTSNQSTSNGTIATVVVQSGIDSSCLFTEAQISDASMIRGTSDDTIMSSSHIFKSVSITNSLTNSVSTSPIMSSSTSPKYAPNLVENNQNATANLAITTAEDNIKSNNKNGDRFVSSGSVSMSHQFQPCVVESPSELKFADHPLLIRGPVVYENTSINSNQGMSKPLLVSTTGKPIVIDSLDANDHNDTELITGDNSVGKRCSANNDTLVKFIQTNSEMPVGGSFYDFCDEMNDPEKKDIGILANENGSCSTEIVTNVETSIMESNSSFPAYDVITVKYDGHSDEEKYIQTCGNTLQDTGISVPNTTNVLMTSGMCTTEDIIHDHNKTYFNLNCTGIKYSDEFGVARNAVPNFNQKLAEEKTCEIVGVNPSSNLDCSASHASPMKSWECEVEELNEKLKQDLPMSDVLLSEESEMNDCFGGELQSSVQCINNNTTHKNGTYVDQYTWYQNCVQNYCLQDEDGDTILHIAIAKEDSRVIEVINRMDASDLDIKNKLGQTPLHLACYVHKVDIIEALIQCGANENTVDQNGNSPLHIACDERSIHMVKSLLKCFENKHENLKAMLNLHNNYGLTPIHIATQKREHAIVKCLVDHGCDLDVQDEKCGATVLVYALMNHDKDLIRLLIDKEANMNVSTSSGLYPLNFAAQSGDIELVKEMVSRDAEIGNKVPEFPLYHPASAEMKIILEKELRKRRRKKKRDESKSTRED